MIDSLLQTVSPRLVAPVCDAIDFSRATFYRHLATLTKPPRVCAPRRRSPRALSDAERQEVLDLLRSPRFADRPPAQIVAVLLDEGRFYCSVRTMYRILDSAGEVRERRNVLTHPAYQKPELMTTAPNTLWSWDITKLLGPAKWSYFNLYVILDVFSRRVVGWMIAYRERAGLAETLIEETCAKENIEPGQLTLHADNGPSMTSKTVALLLGDLGVTKTHSRPYVSDDNPFSESQFKTLKYRPDFPARFGSIEDARAFCRLFFAWYNSEHRHSALGYLTPDTVHQGLANAAVAYRQTTLLAAYAAHPERFVSKVPNPWPVPTAVWINPPKPKPDSPTVAPPRNPTRADLH